MKSMSPIDLMQLGFNAFQTADSIDGMKLAIAEFPFMTNTGFAEGIERAIEEQVPTDQQPDFWQRLAWLRQIANKSSSSSPSGQHILDSSSKTQEPQKSVEELELEEAGR